MQRGRKAKAALPSSLVWKEEQRGQQYKHYKGRHTPKDTPSLVVLVAAWLIGVGQSEGPEESRLKKLRPYERSRCAEHGRVVAALM
jgi:hypothetical protein